MGLSASSTSWRSPGAILDAQPAQAAYEVSRTSVWVCLAIAVLRRVRRGLRFDELDGHQLARAEGLRTGRGADDADLGESFLDPRGDLAARADAQADRDVRILALESSDQRGQHVLARDRGAADDQLA